MNSIHDRPAVVEERTQIGHWEGSLIVGAMQRSAMDTLVDRKTWHTSWCRSAAATRHRVSGTMVDVFTGLPAAFAANADVGSGQRDVPA